MKRREFLKAGSAAVVATTVGAAGVLKAEPAKADANKAEPAKTNADKAGHVKSEAGLARWSSETGDASERDLRARFLGTGAADWKGPDERGEYRRLSGLLLDGRILIDFTKTDSDMLPEGFSADAVFYTHSHPDHYNAADELKYIGAPLVYVGQTWVERAKENFAKAAAEAGCAQPEIIPLGTGESIAMGDITITALPANHSTSDNNEQTLIYLIEKQDVRLLYATDTGGIVSRAARLAGVDAHIKGKPITALVMEATMGIDYDEDYRIFTHSSVGLVKRTADVLLSTGRLTPPEGQPVYLTHLARTLHGTQAELDSALPAPLRAAYDGLEVIFRPCND